MRRELAAEMKMKRAQWKKDREEEADQDAKKGKYLDKELEIRGKEVEDSQIPPLESAEYLVPEIPVDMKEMIGLDRSWCMTCVHQPCLCALTKLEMKISALRRDCYAKEVMDGEALVVEDGEVVGGLLGGQMAAQEPTEPRANHLHDGGGVDEQDEEKPGEQHSPGIGEVKVEKKKEEELQDPDKGDTLGWDNFPPSKEGGRAYDEIFEESRAPHNASRLADPKVEEKKELDDEDEAEVEKEPELEHEAERRIKER